MSSPGDGEWSSHRVNVLADHLAAGLTLGSIAQKMNSSTATVHHQVKKMEISVFGDRAELPANTKGE